MAMPNIPQGALDDVRRQIEKVQKSGTVVEASNKLGEYERNEGYPQILAVILQQALANKNHTTAVVAATQIRKVIDHYWSLQTQRNSTASLPFELAEGDRAHLREHLLTPEMLCSASALVNEQLLSAVAVIAEFDYPTRFPQFLERSVKLAATPATQIWGVRLLEEFSKRSLDDPDVVLQVAQVVLPGLSGLLDAPRDARLRTSLFQTIDGLVTANYEAKQRAGAGAGGAADPLAKLLVEPLLPQWYKAIKDEVEFPVSLDSPALEYEVKRSALLLLRMLMRNCHALIKPRLTEVLSSLCRCVCGLIQRHTDLNVYAGGDDEDLEPVVQFFHSAFITFQTCYTVSEQTAASASQPPTAAADASALANGFKWTCPLADCLTPLVNDLVMGLLMGHQLQEGLEEEYIDDVPRITLDMDEEDDNPEEDMRIREACKSALSGLAAEITSVWDTAHARALTEAIMSGTLRLLATADDLERKKAPHAWKLRETGLFGFHVLLDAMQQPPYEYFEAAPLKVADVVQRAVRPCLEPGVHFLLTARAVWVVPHLLSLPQGHMPPALLQELTQRAVDFTQPPQPDYPLGVCCLALRAVQQIVVCLPEQTASDPIVERAVPKCLELLKLVPMDEENVITRGVIVESLAPLVQAASPPVAVRVGRELILTLSPGLAEQAEHLFISDPCVTVFRAVLTTCFEANRAIWAECCQIVLRTAMQIFERFRAMPPPKGEDDENTRSEMLQASMHLIDTVLLSCDRNCVGNEVVAEFLPLVARCGTDESFDEPLRWTAGDTLARFVWRCPEQLKNVQIDGKPALALCCSVVEQLLKQRNPGAGPLLVQLIEQSHAVLGPAFVRSLIEGAVTVSAHADDYFMFEVSAVYMHVFRILTPAQGLRFLGSMGTLQVSPQHTVEVLPYVLDILFSMLDRWVIRATVERKMLLVELANFLLHDGVPQQLWAYEFHPPGLGPSNSPSKYPGSHKLPIPALIIRFMLDVATTVMQNESFLQSELGPFFEYDSLDEVGEGALFDDQLGDMNPKRFCIDTVRKFAQTHRKIMEDIVSRFNPKDKKHLATLFPDGPDGEPVYLASIIREKPSV